MSGVGFYVIGTPAPQGSKRHVGNGVMVESSKKVKPWRRAVVAAALEVRPVEPLDGPLFVRVRFYLPRPKSAPKSRRFPDRMPDLSKLVRATEDAMTDAGIWADDARVVWIDAAKSYPDRTMSVPGAIVAVGTSSVERNQAFHEAERAAWIAAGDGR